MDLKLIGILFPGFLNKFFFSIILLAGFYRPASPQPASPPFGMLALRPDSLNKYRSPELIYIQTNKGIYEAGEDLWFKAYILNSQFFAPSLLSRTLYLQVAKEGASGPVWQEKYEIINGFADGHVFLPDTLSEGNYLLEAFTGQSFFDDSTEFTAIRKITVKKDMEPHPSFNAAFDKYFYNSGDTIKVDIASFSEDGKPLYAVFEAVLYLNGKGIAQKHAVTNQDGHAMFEFLSEGHGGNLGVGANVKYADKEEELSFPVPCKKGSPAQFNTFPEGGNIVAGIPCKMAFKAVDIDGNPLDVSGTLFEDDTPLLEFKSAHAGMGSFNFTPAPDKKYYIQLTGPVSDSTFLLPEINTEGITLRLAGRDKEYLDFVVSKNSGTEESNVFLRGQMRGKVYCMAEGKLGRELKIKIPLKEFLQQGIAEFTLFNNNLLPVAERLVFINPEKKLYIETGIDKEKYETRGKATLKINARDENGQPVQANLGVSVFDKFYQNPGGPQNILTHYYLSTQLQGRIYDPAYYFGEKNEGREGALDLLMLTQGWRRYLWDEENLASVKNKKQPVVFDWAEGGVEATKNRNKAKGTPQLITAYNPGENDIKNFIAADSSGKFLVTPNHFKTWQGGYIYLKPISPEEYKPRISLASPFQKINEVLKTRSISYPLFNNSIFLDEIMERPFTVASNVIELEEVTIKAKTIKPFRDKYLGQLDSITKMDLNDDWVCPHGFLHNYEQGYAHLVGSNPPYQQCCPDSLKAKPIEGEKYKLVKYEDVGREDGRWILTDMYPIVYHYPKFTEEELLKMNNLSCLKAYYSKREFYQPNYDKETGSDLVPDSRNTLLWAPSVITDKNGEATLEFFCSDINSRFVGKVEGVSSEGLLGSKDFEFKVLKTKPYSWEK